MKIIFSRKGFDAENGGMASPVMPDGAMLSLPIPQDDGIWFDFISYGGHTYEQIIEELKNVNFNACGAHLDPDIRRGGRYENVDDWKPIFGQCDAAETHLENQGVTVGDIFMFFGWFRRTEEVHGEIKYAKGSKDAHMLFGYLQIGKIVKGTETQNYPWHPHAYYGNENNTMYVASDKLVIDGVDTGLPGAGTFKYSDDLVLTMLGQTKSRWKLPEFFKNVNISCHNKDCFKPEGYFQTVRIGQEFVVSESQDVTNWAKSIIVNNIDLREPAPFPAEKAEEIRKEEEIIIAQEEYEEQLREKAERLAEQLEENDCKVRATVEIADGEEIRLITDDFPIDKNDYAAFLVECEVEENIIGTLVYDNVMYDITDSGVILDESDEDFGITKFYNDMKILNYKGFDYFKEYCLGRKIAKPNKNDTDGWASYTFEIEHYTAASDCTCTFRIKTDSNGVIIDIEEPYCEATVNDGRRNSLVEVVPDYIMLEEQMESIFCK